MKDVLPVHGLWWQFLGMAEFDCVAPTCRLCQRMLPT